LTAVHSAVMVLDGAKGIEEQTRKLFEVCRPQGCVSLAAEAATSTLSLGWSLTSPGLLMSARLA
jgi:hypothetical protein